MCEPTTLMYASMAMSAISAVQGAQSANAQADYNAAIARNNAQIAEYQAEDAQVRGEQEATANARKASALRGNQRATMAARGLDLGAGTAQSLIDQTDYFAEVDTGTIRSNADKESWAKRVQATNSQAEAASFQASKRSPLMAGATSLLSSAAMVSSKWAPTGSATAGGGSPYGWAPTTPSGSGLGLKYKW